MIMSGILINTSQGTKLLFASAYATDTISKMSLQKQIWLYYSQFCQRIALENETGCEFWYGFYSNKHIK